MNRAHNFFAGPAILPVEVIEKSKEAAYNFNGMGMSIMEMSHRGKEFDTVIKEAQADCLKIMGLGDEYAVLFLGGGASTQFLSIPTNFLKTKAEYIVTGAWAKKAWQEAQWSAKFEGLEANAIASSADANFNFIPKDWKASDDADYLHFTSNNTIYGTEVKETPDVNCPLVCDMSSNMFSRPYDFSKYNLIYAGAQKNIGPSGVTIVIVKKSWLEEKGNDDAPTMLNYKTHVKADSLFNTPPTFPIYVVGQTFKWILEKGGLEAIKEINDKKANLLYGAIDGSNGYYTGSVADVADRSSMNVTFNLANAELEAKFIKEATAAGMHGLKGHRSVGGARASIYNACPYESVEALVKFMEEFAKNNK
jgi:phosphoserine aminotransferase